VLEEEAVPPARLIEDPGRQLAIHTLSEGKASNWHQGLLYIFRSLGKVSPFYLKCDWKVKKTFPHDLVLRGEV